MRFFACAFLWKRIVRQEIRCWRMMWSMDNCKRCGYCCKRREKNVEGVKPLDCKLIVVDLITAGSWNTTTILCIGLLEICYEVAFDLQVVFFAQWVAQPRTHIATTFVLSLIGHVLDEVKILQEFKLEATRNDFASLEQKLRVVQQPQFAAQELQVWSRTAILWQKLMVNHGLQLLYPDCVKSKTQRRVAKKWENSQEIRRYNALATCKGVGKAC